MGILMLKELSQPLHELLCKRLTLIRLVRFRPALIINGKPDLICIYHPIRVNVIVAGRGVLRSTYRTSSLFILLF